MWNLKETLDKLNKEDLYERWKLREKTIASKTQAVESEKDIKLLIRGYDLISIRKSNSPQCVSETCLFIAKGKNNLILWATGLGSGHYDIFGRVIKLPLDKIKYGNPLKVQEYDGNLFFNLNQRSFNMLHNSGLI
jgi:hypothetical protein